MTLISGDFLEKTGLSASPDVSIPNADSLKGCTDLLGKVNRPFSKSGSENVLGRG